MYLRVQVTPHIVDHTVGVVRRSSSVAFGSLVLGVSEWVLTCACVSECGAVIQPMGVCVCVSTIVGALPSYVGRAVFGGVSP